MLFIVGVSSLLNTSYDSSFLFHTFWQEVECYVILKFVNDRKNNSMIDKLVN